MNDELNDFREFLGRRRATAADFVRGKPQAVAELVTHDFPATFFAPNGAVVQSAPEVVKSFRHGSFQFEDSGETQIDILDSHASNGLAYWIGLQHATVRTRGNSESNRMTLRVTEVFRREDGQWKLVHRHADMAGREQLKKEETRTAHP